MDFRYNESINLGFNFTELLILTVKLLICHYLFGRMLTKRNVAFFGFFQIYDDPDCHQKENPNSFQNLGLYIFINAKFTFSSASS